MLDGVPLLNVERLSDTELRAIVPHGLPAGPHALTVVGPYGLSGSMAGGWFASDLPPAVDRLDLVDRAAPLPLRDRGGARELAGAGHESNRGELLAVAVGLQPGREAVEAARAVAGAAVHNERACPLAVPPRNSRQ